MLIPEILLEKETISRILSSFASINQLNVILLSVNHRKLDVYTFNPFENKTSVFNQSKIDVFADKTENLSGFVLNALKIDANDFEADNFHENSFFDAGVIPVIISEMKGNLKIASTKFKSVQKAIVENNVSLLLDPTTTVFHDEILESLYPHELEYKVFIVPKSKPISIEESLQSIHKDNTWMLFLFYNKIYGLVWCILRKFLGLPVKFLHWADYNAVNDTLYAKLKKHPLENLLLLSSTLFVTISVLASQAILLVAMTTLQFHSEINTVEELRKLDFSVIALEPFETSFDNFTGRTEIIEDLAFIEDLFYNTKDSNGSIFLLPHKSAEFIVASRFNRKNGMAISCFILDATFWFSGIPLYHIMREKLLPSFKSYQVRRGSPFFRTMDKLLFRLYEGGFPSLRRKRIMDWYKIKGVLMPPNLIEPENETKFYMLKTYLYIFTLYPYSFAYFVCEHIWFRLYPRIKKRIQRRIRADL